MRNTTINQRIIYSNVSIALRARKLSKADLNLIAKQRLIGRPYFIIDLGPRLLVRIAMKWSCVDGPLPVSQNAFTANFRIVLALQMLCHSGTRQNEEFWRIFILFTSETHSHSGLTSLRHLSQGPRILAPRLGICRVSDMMKRAKVLRLPDIQTRVSGTILVPTHCRVFVNDTCCRSRDHWDEARAYRHWRGRWAENIQTFHMVIPSSCLLHARRQ